MRVELQFHTHTLPTSAHGPAGCVTTEQNRSRRPDQTWHSAVVLGDKERHARALFDGIATSYDVPAEALSFGQYGRWRRALVRGLDVPPGARALDVATGTGLIARDIEARSGATVFGLDQSEQMLRAGVRARSVGGTADALPFSDGVFDVVTFSYLFRYVPDAIATLHELTRVLRPGGMLGSVEFGVPRARLARLGWRVYARGVFPALCRMLGKGWRDVGGFLPGSIEAWARAWPVERQIEAWRAAGLTGVRARSLTLGTGIVMVGRKHDDTA